MANAQSKAKQKSAEAALSAKRGDPKVSDLQGASKDMYDSTGESELEDRALTGREDLSEQAANE